MELRLAETSCIYIVGNWNQIAVLISIIDGFQKCVFMYIYCLFASSSDDATQLEVISPKGEVRFWGGNGSARDCVALLFVHICVDFALFSFNYIELCYFIDEAGGHIRDD